VIIHRSLEVLFLAAVVTSAVLVSSSSADVYGGDQCTLQDTDPLKCMMCAVGFESHQTSRVGMEAVGGTVMTRKVDKSGYFPNDICGVVHQTKNGRFQFTSQRKNPRLPSEGATLNMIRTAAQAAIKNGPTGYLGFHATTPRAFCAGVKIDGNCYRQHKEIQVSTAPVIRYTDAQANAPRAQD
jgi:hypothetical protein